MTSLMIRYVRIVFIFHFIPLITTGSRVRYSCSSSVNYDFQIFGLCLLPVFCAGCLFI